MIWPETIERAVTAFGKLPGVGYKTALRKVLAMSNWSKAELEEFSESIKLMTELNRCNDCHLFSEEAVCSVCRSEERQSEKTICVIENVKDLMAIENSNQYRGLYHILGGVLNPLMGVTPDHLRVDKLVERIKELNIENLILAINPSVEGDVTCSYIRELLPEYINVERIGFGVPIGSSLEYLDPLTISKAFENRKTV